MLVFCAIVYLLYSITMKKNLVSGNKLKVTTSFYPLTFLVEQIGGSQVVVTTLTPAGVEPHDFEPSTRDITDLETQNILFLNGGGLEGYIDKLENNLSSSKITIITVGSPFITLSGDPHIWLDPILFQREADSVLSALISADTRHKSYFEANASILRNNLTVLHHEFSTGLSQCAKKDIVTSHLAFSYLSNQYNLRQVAISGLTPEQEPSSKTLSDITAFVKKKNIQYIFFETLATPLIAETIAHETGAHTLILNPIEGLTKEDITNGKTYLSIQKENLKNLRIALTCK